MRPWLNIKAAKKLKPREKKKVATSLTKIEEDIQVLNRDLDSMARANLIGSGEVGRRKAMMSSLESQLRTVRDMMNDVGSKRREDLFDQARRTEETEATMQRSNHELLSDQEVVRDRQDAALDSVLTGIQRVGQISRDIGGELDLQAPLLDDLASSVDAADSKVVRNIERVEHIESKESGGWALLCCIVLLVVVIVFFAASNLPCHVFAPSRC